MPDISIRVDYAAFMRNAMQNKEPDPAQAAVLAEMAGAGGISCHLRRDRLHTCDRDLYMLKEIVKTKLILQIYPDDELLERALEVKPDLVILMPEDDEEPFKQSGINLQANADKYAQAVSSLQAENIKTGYFIDPIETIIKEAARAKVDVVELNARDYADADSPVDRDKEIERLEHMADLTKKLGMSTYCCGGLNYKNIRRLIDLSVFDGFVVGGAVAVKAMMLGFEKAVRELMNTAHMA